RNARPRRGVVESRYRRVKLRQNRILLYEGKTDDSWDRFDLRIGWGGRMRRVLQWISGLWTLLRHIDFGFHRSRRSSVLCSWSGILVRRRILRLETRTLGVATWSPGLGSRPLRCAAVLTDSGRGVDSLPFPYQAVTSPPTKPRDVPTTISRTSWRFK